MTSLVPVDEGLPAGSWQINALQVLNGSDFLLEELPPPDWLVEGFLPHPGMSLLVGDGGANKSWLAIEVAISLATRTPVAGNLAVRDRRRVLYVQSDSSKPAFQDRLRKVLAGKDRKFEDLKDWLKLVTNQHLNLSSDVGLATLRQLLLYARDQKAPIDLVIIDVLYEFHSADENSSTDMRPLILGLRRLRDELSTSFLILHHTNKWNGSGNSGSKSSRGSNAVWNSMDGRFYVARRANGWSRMEEFYLKEAESGRQFRYRPVINSDSCRFEFSWDDEKRENKQTLAEKRKQELVAYVHENGRIDRKQAQSLLGVGSANTSNKVLEELFKDGIFERFEEKVGKAKAYVYQLPS